MKHFSPILAGAALLLSNEAFAATHYVGPFGHPTIQAAINAAQNGDVINIYPNTYDEAISIGKSLTVQKWPSISGYVAISQPTSTNATVRISSPSVSVTLRELSIAGGAAGLRGPTLTTPFTPLSAIPTVFLYDVSIILSGSSGGISGYMNLYARRLSVIATGGTGIGITGNADLVETTSSNNQGRGISIQNRAQTPSWWVNRMIDVSAKHNAQGGLQLTGGAGESFAIDRSHFDQNTLFGIKLVRAHDTLITNSTASSNDADANHAWGDGFMAYNSENVAIVGTTFYGNDRAGASVWGCADPYDPTSVRLTNVQLYRNPIALNAERYGTNCRARGARFTDGGGVQCTNASGAPITCAVQSSQLEPPPPP